MTESSAEVAEILQGVMGSCLKGVEYCILPADRLVPTSVELGGEIVLIWVDQRQTHFTWSGSPGAKQDWVLRATAVSLLSQPSTATDVSSSDPWASLIGSELTESEVLGWAGEPTIVRLRFATGSVLVGVGSNGWFGSTDSVMVRPDSSPFLDFPVPIESIWVSSHVA